MASKLFSNIKDIRFKFKRIGCFGLLTVLSFVIFVVAISCIELVFKKQGDGKFPPDLETIIPIFYTIVIICFLAAFSFCLYNSIVLMKTYAQEIEAVPHLKPMVITACVIPCLSFIGLSILNKYLFNLANGIDLQAERESKQSAKAKAREEKQLAKQAAKEEKTLAKQVAKEEKEVQKSTEVAETTKTITEADVVNNQSILINNQWYYRDDQQNWYISKDGATWEATSNPLAK